MSAKPQHPSPCNPRQCQRNLRTLFKLVIQKGIHQPSVGLRMNSLLPLSLVAALSAFALTTVTAADTSSPSKQIDALVLKGLAKQKLTANKPANDETFLRRVYLDVTGRIPTPDEALSFYQSKDANKRAKLIDKLLASDGYVQHFFNYWADVLRAQSTGIGDSSAAQEFLNFIRSSLRENKPSTSSLASSWLLKARSSKLVPWVTTCGTAG